MPSSIEKAAEMLVFPHHKDVEYSDCHGDYNHFWTVSLWFKKLPMLETGYSEESVHRITSTDQREKLDLPVTQNRFEHSKSD